MQSLLLRSTQIKKGLDLSKSITHLKPYRAYFIKAGKNTNTIFIQT